MRPTPDTVMLFAAGFGTRMGALTQDRPKPMVEVAGRPLIDHALEQVHTFGARKIVCNLHYLPERLETHLAQTGVLLSLEMPDILDTGGGLKNALPLLQADTVFTMNTDAVWRGPNAFRVLANAWNPDQMDALLLCVSKTNAIGHTGNGDFVIGHDQIAQRGPGDIYTGLQIIKTAGLETISKSVFSLNLLWDQMLSEGRLHAIHYPGTWCDVGSPEGVRLADTFLDADRS